MMFYPSCLLYDLFLPEREARNKTSLLQNGTKQSHTYSSVVPILEGFTNFSLSAGNIEIPQS